MATTLIKPPALSRAEVCGSGAPRVRFWFAARHASATERTDAVSAKPAVAAGIKSPATTQMQLWIERHPWVIMGEFRQG
ncbi:hypothetical protein [Afipia birgiae]|uniref:hypothetical protein n=1 Tax=Afipia birgiae TaxID=151414 RepID=UPI001FCC531C|nr:hypothetical protein [Afipia birgiae]